MRMRNIEGVKLELEACRYKFIGGHNTYWEVEYGFFGNIRRFLSDNMGNEVLSQATRNHLQYLDAEISKRIKRDEWVFGPQYDELFSSVESIYSSIFVKIYDELFWMFDKLAVEIKNCATKILNKIDEYKSDSGNKNKELEISSLVHELIALLDESGYGKYSRFARHNYIPIVVLEVQNALNGASLEDKCQRPLKALLAVYAKYRRYNECDEIYVGDTCIPIDIFKKFVFFKDEYTSELQEFLRANPRLFRTAEPELFKNIWKVIAINDGLIRTLLMYRGDYPTLFRAAVSWGYVEIVDNLLLKAKEDVDILRELLESSFALECAVIKDQEEMVTSILNAALEAGILNEVLESSNEYSQMAFRFIRSVGMEEIFASFYFQSLSNTATPAASVENAKVSICPALLSKPYKEVPVRNIGDLVIDSCLLL